jgi:predicted permease
LLNGYSHQRALQLFERLENELAALPGVTGVTNSSISLLNHDSDISSVVVEGYSAGPDTDAASLYHKVGPSYFSTLGIPLIAGREFSRSDAAGSGKVAIINEAFVKRFNLGREPIGKHIRDTRYGPQQDMEIVGVVRDSKYLGVRENKPPLFYFPYRQDDEIRYLTFYVRTSMNPDQFLPNVIKLMARLDPNLPVENLRTMPRQVYENIFMDRITSILSSAFACLATLLAAVGLYGVLAYTVEQRTREIGLRIALGASQAQVRRMVLCQTGMMTLIGGVIGLALGIGFGRIAQSMLYELNGSDPLLLCGSAVALVLIALSAGYLPARVASKIDPMQALRYD